MLPIRTAHQPRSQRRMESVSPRQYVNRPVYTAETPPSRRQNANPKSVVVQSYPAESINSSPLLAYQARKEAINRENERRSAASPLRDLLAEQKAAERKVRRQKRRSKEERRRRRQPPRRSCSIVIMNRGSRQPRATTKSAPASRRVSQGDNPSQTGNAAPAINVFLPVRRHRQSEAMTSPRPSASQPQPQTASQNQHFTTVKDLYIGVKSKREAAKAIKELNADFLLYYRQPKPVANKSIPSNHLRLFMVYQADDNGQIEHTEIRYHRSKANSSCKGYRLECDASRKFCSLEGLCHYYALNGCAQLSQQASTNQSRHRGHHKCESDEVSSTNAPSEEEIQMNEVVTDESDLPLTAQQDYSRPSDAETPLIQRNVQRHRVRRSDASHFDRRQRRRIKSNAGRRPVFKAASSQSDVETAVKPPSVSEYDDLRSIELDGPELSDSDGNVSAISGQQEQTANKAAVGADNDDNKDEPEDVIDYDDYQLPSSLEVAADDWTGKDEDNVATSDDDAFVEKKTRRKKNQTPNKNPSDKPQKESNNDTLSI